MCIVCASNYTQTIHKPYIEAFKTLHRECSQNYTRSGTQTLHFVFEHESREWNLEHERSGWCEWNLEREWSERSEWSERRERRERSERSESYVKQEMAIGGDATRHFCAPLQKSNNFESFFSDLTLTFLTYRNTFRLPILPTRRIIFLCLPLIKIRRRQILTGCAPNFSWERS